MTRQIPSEGLVALLAELEGFREKAYQDQAGVWTIGFGTTVIRGRKVQQGDVMTRNIAVDILREQCRDFGLSVDAVVPETVGQIAFDALVSFAYNVGAEAFKMSTLRLRVASGDMQGAADQFPRWIHVGREENEGLRRRRALERALFLYGCA